MEKAIWIVVTIAVALIIGVIVVASTNTTMKEATTGVSNKIKQVIGGLGTGSNGYTTSERESIKSGGGRGGIMDIILSGIAEDLYITLPDRQAQ